jgi:hypothetical protein
MGNRGVQNAQMQGPRPSQTGEEWPHILMAEGDVRFDGLARV